MTRVLWFERVDFAGRDCAGDRTFPIGSSFRIAETEANRRSDATPSRRAPPRAEPSLSRSFPFLRSPREDASADVHSTSVAFHAPGEDRTAGRIVEEVGMSSAKNYSDKIAMHLQRQAEQTAVVDALLREVRELTGRKRRKMENGSRVDSKSTGVGPDGSPLAVSPARMLQNQSAAGTSRPPKLMKIDLDALGSHPPVDSGLQPERKKSETGGAGSAKTIKAVTEVESLHDQGPTSDRPRADDAGRWDPGFSESHDAVRFYPLVGDGSCLISRRRF
ncbi:unnamed protein product [Darwinula stevensoni]|uniref:Transducer of regulated CREB activity N-terminal domain-containing protein n=1 Tax=Darwinula stevensoni TaxID=69355 RepID=A0A7R9AB93_9CRUS|nr:unnamed protein product [Darwinula stevensoni]CAG0899207.1 unnamed protein product [Darwinula stevensoni]